MKKMQIVSVALSAMVVLASFAGVAEARSSKSGSVYVHGYFRKDGTYVHSYHRSAPNSTITDNWSYCGNVNPYTGAVGTIGYGGSATTYGAGT